MSQSEASPTPEQWRQATCAVALQEGDDPCLTGEDALFLDVDGTLVEFADRPDAVFAPASLVETLARVEARLGGALALVSGRRIEELDRLFQPLRLRASGVHGIEFRLEPGEAPQLWSQPPDLPPRLVAEIAELTNGFSGVLIEHKGYSLAVHFRRSPALGATLRDALRVLMERDESRGVELLDAHLAFEIKPKGFDKGGAIRRFLDYETFRGRRPVFIGDDLTDEAGFAVARACGGRAYSVAGPRAGALCAFAGPAEVRAWLSEFAGLRNFG
jgi:trehalose 6-phosphate phosphatase